VDNLLFVVVAMTSVMIGWLQRSPVLPVDVYFII